jgi:hypothetical protein
MSPNLLGALRLVREGRGEEAELAKTDLDEREVPRLELALAHRNGDGERAVSLAAELWQAAEVDPTVLAVLIHYHHPQLFEPASALLARTLADSSLDREAILVRLSRAPADLEAWRDLLSHLASVGCDVEAVDGVASALRESVGGFELWSLLATTLLIYRRRRALMLAVTLCRAAFPHAFEAHAAIALIFVGLGDVAAAEAELARVRPQDKAHVLVLAARDAIARLRAIAPARKG